MSMIKSNSEGHFDLQSVSEVFRKIQNITGYSVKTLESEAELIGGMRAINSYLKSADKKYKNKILRIFEIEMRLHARYEAEKQIALQLALILNTLITTHSNVAG